MTQEQEKAVATAITGTFMWSFKKGDNIVYNYDIVWELYKVRALVDDQSSKKKFNKPIIIILASIIECILDDFTNRTQQFVHEKMQNITEAQVRDFKTKKRDKFEHYIQAAKKHNIFDSEDGKIYEDLDFMRKMRNRFHIQNSNYSLDADEYKIFTDSNRRLTEKAFERVIHSMMTRFYRWGGSKTQPKDMLYPWK